MRLGFVGNSSLVYCGGGYWYRGGEWRYLHAVAPLFDAVDICVHVENCRSSSARVRRRYPWPLQVPNGTVHPLPASSTQLPFLGWLIKQISTYGMLADLSQRWDFGFVMAPAWTAPMVWFRSWVDHWPYAVSFRGDWAGIAKHRLSRGPAFRRLLPFYVAIVKRLESRLMRDARIRMASGFVLSDRYPALSESIILTVNLDLRPDQFRRRQDTCQREPVNLIYVGSLVPRKGVDVILHALARVRAMQWTLKVVGDGPERAALENLSSRLGIEDQVIFSGYVSDRQQLLDLYLQSDILLVASYSEGFPRVIYEGLSQSLPVIATRVGGVANLLEDGRTALLVDPDDPDGLAEAVVRLAQDASLRQQIIQAGRDLAYDIVSDDPVEKAVRLFERELGQAAR